MLPDPVAIAIDWLSDDTDLAALDATISGDLVGYLAGGRWVVVTVTGGSRPLPFRLDAPRLDINTYGETRAMAHLLCETAMSSLYAARNYVHSTGVVAGVEFGVRPADMTDPVNHQYRFVGDLTFHVRSKP